ncbi:MAG: hypothetical protein JJD97_12110 [Gemmatimonadaceae bacterium]|nr:hypothetical protein [Gemmatimonadaceae bacterium]
MSVDPVMIETVARRPPSRPVARVWATLAVASLATLVFAACSGRESSPQSESAAAVAGPEAHPDAGRGHLQLTGDASVDTDFAVERCSIGPAGDGLLNGYRMNAKATRGTLQMLTLAVKSYEHDGTFSPIADSAKKAIVGKGAVSGPLAMTIGRENSTVPLPVLMRPESRLTITIADSGARGTADFSEMTSPVAMEDVDIKAPTHAKHKTFAGSITWHCASVARLDSATIDAAKGMTKGLTPVH